MAEHAVLVVDDDDALRDTLAQALETGQFDVSTAGSGTEAIRELQAREFSVVVTDVVMPAPDGFEVLKEARARYPHCRIIMLTGQGSRDLAVQAMQLGATYYIEKPVDLHELRTKVAKCLQDYAKDLEYESLRSQVERNYGFEGIVGQDPKMVRVLDVLRQIAPTNASVLILGESGTGKELVARAVHRYSPRRAQAFVALNCGGLSEGTIESELFGHVKGAYTGALADREGKFEYADKGTLFLDEVGEMPMATQVKLLRVLEDREVTRLGANRPRRVDVRVLAATNADLPTRVKEGAFREDLYYRLKVVTIDLPPLRERRADIKLLVRYFLQHFCEVHDKDIDDVDRDALTALTQYEWPGNVRELRNCVESMVVRARGNILTRDDLPPEVWSPGEPEHDNWAFLAGRTQDEVEKNHIRVSLEMTDGNRVKAAKAMGISERTLYRKIKDYGL
ncbi:MAG: sigma-54 dependent transcriptional regulator [Planctomycetota bacterium]